jgi:glycosyltransferase involved in cell wall biosynthesis
MRIVIIADSVDTQNAGIHVYTRNMIESLEKLSELEIICIRVKNGSKIHFKNDIIVPGIIPFLKKDPFRIFISVPRIIRKLNPDIVIEPAHFGPFNLSPDIKRVTIIHDLTPVKFPQWHKLLSRTLQKIFLPSILKRASLVITNSENTLKDLSETYPFTNDKTVRIYPGTDPFFFIPGNEIVYNKEPFFLSVGTIEPRKNFSILLDAYQLFREKTNLNHSLIICGGKGWKNKLFYQKLKNHPFKNDIKILGYVNKEELKKLYSITTAFIYPSLYEGFGFPVIEAMSCGAPCIVSLVSSLTEVGDDAPLYFNPLSTVELALCMEQLAGSKEMQKKLIEKGFNQAHQFNWVKYVSELENQLAMLLAPKNLFLRKNEN